MTGRLSSSGSGARQTLYRIFGLLVASDLPLPEANAIEDVLEGASADVRIVVGSVPETLPNGKAHASWLIVENNRCLLEFPGIGRFLAESGREIRVEKASEASWDDLRGFLLGSALAAVLHQRGLVPLHVSALLSPFGVVAFTGDSGAGKSTLAATLNTQFRWPLISDDVAILSVTGREVRLESGINTVKLWADALDRLNRSSAGLRRDLTRYDKFHAIEGAKFAGGQHSLRQLVKLEWSDEGRGELNSVFGREAYKIALSSVYRPEFADALSNLQSVASTCMRLAAEVRISIWTRPKALDTQSAVAQLIEKIEAR